MKRIKEMEYIDYSYCNSEYVEDKTWLRRFEKNLNGMPIIIVLAALGLVSWSITYILL